MWVRVAAAVEFSSTLAYGSFLQPAPLIKKLHYQNMRFHALGKKRVTQITTNLHDMYIKPH